MGRPRKIPPLPTAAVRGGGDVLTLAPCPKCGLKLGPGNTPSGLAIHDCREVQRLRKAADTKTAAVPLEQRLREHLDERLESMTAKDVAQVLVVLERQKQSKSSGPSDALRAMLVT